MATYHKHPRNLRIISLAARELLKTKYLLQTFVMFTFTIKHRPNSRNMNISPY